MSIADRLLVGGLIVAMFVFCGIPAVVALFNRVRFRSGMGLVWPRVLALLAAAMLGLVLWPAAHEVFLLNEWLGISVARARSDRLRARSFSEQWQNISPVWILVDAGRRAGRVRGVVLSRDPVHVAAAR